MTAEAGERHGEELNPATLSKDPPLAGLTIATPEPPPVPTPEPRLSYGQRYRRRQIAKGLCGCGQREPRPGKKTCEPCGRYKHREKSPP